MVGKVPIVILFSSMVFYINAIRITLSVSDMQGNCIKDVECAELFDWVIQVSDFNDVQSLKFSRMINTKCFVDKAPEVKKIFHYGKLDQVVYKIRTFANNPGFYKNIRAIIISEGDEYSSNAITLDVKPIGSIKKNTDSGKRGPITLEFSIDKKRVVVGEKVVGTIKICAKPELRFQVRSDFFNDQSIKHSSKHYQTKKIEHINGESYICVESSWVFYPKKPGQYNFVLPVDYEISNFQSSGFFRFMTTDQKSVYSNSITLDVDVLPQAISEPLVGRSLEVTLNLNPAVCKQQEGITGVLELSFHGDLDDFNYTMLQDLPQSIHCFFSRATNEFPSNIMQPMRKRFEFILQPKESGNIEIPEQTFWYYDTLTHSKKVVKSNSVALTILSRPSEQAGPQEIEQSISTNIPLQEESKVKKFHTITHLGKQYQLPWMLFFSILIISGPLFIAYPLRLRLRRRLQLREDALSKLMQAKQKNDFGTLYHIFIRFISERIPETRGMVTYDQMIDRLSISADDKRVLRELFKTLVVYAFDNGQSYDYTLFEKIETWIKVLDRSL